MEMKHLLTEFGEETTCHGLSHIVNKKHSPIRRIAWAFLVLGLTAGAVWQLTTKILEYTSYSTSTELHEEYTSEVMFPSVTFCNLNKFFDVKSELEVATLNALLRVASPYRDRTYDKWWTKEVEKFLEELESEGIDYFYLSKEIRKKGWVLTNKTLRFCTFQHRKCGVENFTAVITPMGLCYTFTTNETVVQNVPGSSHGLVLYLDINQVGYSSHPMFGYPGAGVKVHIHNHYEPEQIDSFGMSVPSGHAGHMVLTKTERNLMYRPWGVCNQNVKKLNDHEHYSTSACMKECRAEYIVEICGCKPFWYQFLPEVLECGVWEVLNCSGEAEANFTENYTMKSCNCEEPCRYVVYEPLISYSTFPSIEVGEILSSEAYVDERDAALIIGHNYTTGDPGFEKLQNYRNNHLMLDIYFDSLSFSRITQTKAVSEVSLMSDMGGLLGLWLGISFVTLSEFAQLVIGLIKLMFPQSTSTTRVRGLDIERGGSARSSRNSEWGRASTRSRGASDQWGRMGPEEKKSVRRESLFNVTTPVAIQPPRIDNFMEVEQNNKENGRGF